MNKMKVIGLKNARVYDPTQKADGELMTLWMADGRIISEPSQDIQKAQGFRRILDLTNPENAA